MLSSFLPHRRELGLIRLFKMALIFKITKKKWDQALIIRGRNAAELSYLTKNAKIHWGSSIKKKFRKCQEKTPKKYFEKSTKKIKKKFKKI